MESWNIACILARSVCSCYYDDVHCVVFDALLRNPLGSRVRTTTLSIELHIPKKNIQKVFNELQRDGLVLGEAHKAASGTSKAFRTGGLLSDNTAMSWYFDPFRFARSLLYRHYKMLELCENPSGNQLEEFYRCTSTKCILLNRKIGVFEATQQVGADFKFRCLRCKGELQQAGANEFQIEKLNLKTRVNQQLKGIYDGLDELIVALEQERIAIEQRVEAEKFGKIDEINEVVTVKVPSESTIDVKALKRSDLSTESEKYIKKNTKLPWEMEKESSGTISEDAIEASINKVVHNSNNILDSELESNTLLIPPNSVNRFFELKNKFDELAKYPENIIKEKTKKFLIPNYSRSQVDDMPLSDYLEFC